MFDITLTLTILSPMFYCKSANYLNEITECLVEWNPCSYVNGSQQERPNFKNEISKPVKQYTIPIFIKKKKYTIPIMDQVLNI